MPSAVRNALHVPDKIPRYLQSSAGYVLADPIPVYMEQQHTLAAERHQQIIKTQNRFEKGNSVARRLHKMDTMRSPSPVAKSSAPLCCSTGNIAHGATARFLHEMEVESQNERSAKLKSSEAKPTPQPTIQQFMRRPRRYDLITLRNTDSLDFSSGLDVWKRENFELADLEAPRDFYAPKVVTANLEQTKQLAFNQRGRRRLFKTTAQTMSSENTTLRSENEVVRQLKIKAKPEADTYLTIHRTAHHIGLRSPSPAQKI